MKKAYGYLVGGILAASALAVTTPGLASTVPLTLPDAVYANGVDITLPSGYELYQYTDQPTGGLLITGSNTNYPFPVYWTGRTDNNYGVPAISSYMSAGRGVEGVAGSSLTYYIAFTGAAGTIPVTVKAHGEVGAFANLSEGEGAPPGDPLEDTASVLLQIYPADDFFNQVLSASASVDRYYTPLGQSFTVDGQYDFVANTVYEVMMSADVSAAYTHLSLASIDPYFVPPAGYGVITSFGVGNSPAVAPIPAALPLFTSGLGALGLFGWRRRRKATENA